VLTRRHQRVIDRFADVCVRDDRILAAFVGGSIAAATADEHSDLDLYALIRPEAYDQLLSEHRQFVEQWASPVFLEHFDGFGFDMLVFILQDGIQGELGIAKPDKFLHIHGGAYAVLIDKEELLDGVEFPLQRPEREHQLRVFKEANALVLERSFALEFGNASSAPLDCRWLCGVHASEVRPPCAATERLCLLCRGL
jgi:hypothetical protein